MKAKSEPATERRNESLTAGLTTSELERWKDLADRKGKRPATMAREVILAHLVKHEAKQAAAS